MSSIVHSIPYLLLCFPWKICRQINCQPHCASTMERHYNIIVPMLEIIDSCWAMGEGTTSRLIDCLICGHVALDVWNASCKGNKWKIIIAASSHGQNILLESGPPSFNTIIIVIYVVITVVKSFNYHYHYCNYHEFHFQAWLHLPFCPLMEPLSPKMGVVSHIELKTVQDIHDHQYKVALARKVCNRNLNRGEILTLL